MLRAPQGGRVSGSGSSRGSGASRPGSGGPRLCARYESHRTGGGEKYVKRNQKSSTHRKKGSGKLGNGLGGYICFVVLLSRTIEATLSLPLGGWLCTLSGGKRNWGSEKGGGTGPRKKVLMSRILRWYSSALSNLRLPGSLVRALCCKAGCRNNATLVDVEVFVPTPSTLGLKGVPGNLRLEGRPFRPPGFEYSQHRWTPFPSVERVNRTR